VARCRHEHPMSLTWDGPSNRWMTGGDDARACRRCLALLPLGPANDADPRVAVEIRAARLYLKMAIVDGETPFVADGWCCHRDGYAPNHDHPDAWAGYLVYAMCHDSEVG
jgi:hypothetical protein